MTFTVSLFTVYKGAKGIGLDETSPLTAFLAASGISAVVTVMAYPLMLRHARYLEEQEAKEDALAVGGGPGPVPAPEDSPAAGAGPEPAPEGVPDSSDSPAATETDKSQAREVKITDAKTE